MSSVKSLTDSHRASIAIAACSAVAGKEPDDLLLIEALQKRGIAAAHIAWDADGVDWSSFSLVVVRSTWDYPERRNLFLTWAASLRRVLNPLDVLRWNTDKHYLSELDAAGLPVIPTQFLEPGEALESFGRPFVIKPAISCGAKDTAHYTADAGRAASEHVRRLHGDGRTVMVQPYLSDIEQHGEANLVFIRGKYSHAIRREALLRHPGVVHGGETIPQCTQLYEASRDERSLAEAALAVIPGGQGAALYARVDLAPGPRGEPLILEVELTEPSLFLSYSETAVGRLAEAIAAEL
jgi:glutathione synthase/RimK-type ligase-like ATP-grasp enzyme